MRQMFCWVLLLASSLAFAESEVKRATNAVSWSHIATWTFALVMVLGVFLLCVWGIRKLGMLPVQQRIPMKVLGALSLGLREKLMLVQVGDKQLVLGVTPGRIETLLVIDDTLCDAQSPKTPTTDTDFSSEFNAMMVGESEHG